MPLCSIVRFCQRCGRTFGWVFVVRLSVIISWVGMIVAVRTLQMLDHVATASCLVGAMDTNVGVVFACPGGLKCIPFPTRLFASGRNCIDILSSCRQAQVSSCNYRKIDRIIIVEATHSLAEINRQVFRVQVITSSAFTNLRCIPFSTASLGGRRNRRDIFLSCWLLM